MDFKEEIKNIAELHKIPQSEILWGEVDAFFNEHGGHVGYEVITGQYEDRSGIDYIRVRCLGSIDLDCSHVRQRNDFAFSTLYQSDKDSLELLIQKRKR